MALNNLDTLRSYGSAGDELENFPPDYLRNLNRSTPVPPPSLTLANPVGGNATGSDTDSLHKPTWQEQMQLASFITDTTKIKNGECERRRVSMREKKSPASRPGSFLLLISLAACVVNGRACARRSLPLP